MAPASLRRASAVAGAEGQDIEAREIALEGEIAIVELERPADPVFIEFERDRVGRRLISGAGLEVADRHGPARQLGERLLLGGRLEVRAGAGLDAASDEGQGVVDPLAVVRAVVDLDGNGGLA